MAARNERLTPPQRIVTQIFRDISRFPHGPVGSKFYCPAPYFYLPRDVGTCLSLSPVPPRHDLVTDPTCPQPGFTLPRRQFVTLNRLRCGQARCAESLHRWGVIASPACPCGESHQTTRHIVEECPLTAFPGGLQRLHQAGPDAVEWLSRLSLKL